jgi:hypothetical protein
MKKVLVFALAVLMLASWVVLGNAGGKTRLDLKVGEEIFACNCGEACPCNTLSRNPGKCTCGVEMVKAKVVKAGDGTAALLAPGWEKARTFKTVGKYACACGPQCNCDTISQNPGKCTCGVEMKAVN